MISRHNPRVRTHGLPSLCVLTLALVAALVHPGRARAETPDERARILYAAGKDHYDHGRYEDAAREFEAAFTLSPRPELRYNLYLAYERMGRFDTALGHLEAYLQGGQLSPDERGRLEARRDALRERAAHGAAPPPVETTAPPPPAATTSASASPMPQSGFMARVALGVGYANAETSDYKVYGGTGAAFLLAGWRLVPSFSLHASLWGFSMVGPSVQNKGALSIVAKDNATYSSGALGAGATIDLPARFYVSASLGAGNVTTDRGNTHAETKLGFALMALFGKDWYLGNHFWVGGVASLAFLTLKETIDPLAGAPREERVNVVLFSLLGTLAFD